MPEEINLTDRAVCPARAVLSTHAPAPAPAPAPRKRQEMKYELVFEGSATAPYFPRYRRHHRSVESATQTAGEVYRRLEDVGLYETIKGHTAIVYGPDLPHDGKCISIAALEIKLVANGEKK